MYLAAHGARTPMLALRGLLRVRNIIVVGVPALALFVLAHVAPGGHEIRAGVAALVVSPAPLIGPELLIRGGRRGDTAGVLVLGTAIVSLALLAARPIAEPAAVMAGVEAFAIPALLANAIPVVRDAVLAPIRWLAWLAAAGVVVATVASGPSLDAYAVVAAAAVLAVGVLAAAVAAWVESRDLVTAITGAGLRDPVVACAIALAAGPAAVAVPLVYAVFCLGLAAVLLLRR